MSEARQLPFDFPHAPRFRDGELLPNAGCSEAEALLASTARWPLGRLALWGQLGAGKTHLLRVWAARERAVFIEAPRLESAPWPDTALALDDIDRVADPACLLHVLNAAAEAGRPVLMAATVAPARLTFGPPDLVSRLRATMAVEIGPADDAFLADLLAHLLLQRQIDVAAPVRAWVHRRLPRTPGAVVRAVDLLDRAALAAGSPVTRALAGSALSELLVEDEGLS